MEANQKKIGQKPVAGLNAKRVSFSGNVQKDVDINELEASLAEREMKLEAEKLQLENFKKQSEESKRKEKLAAIDAALENAKRYDDWAKSEISKVNADKELAETYLQMARDSNAEAKALQTELGLITQTEENEGVAEKKGFWSLLHNWGWVISLLVASSAIYFSYNSVMNFKAEIDAKNAAIEDPSLKIGNPYDESSIQGIVYDNLIQLTDIPKLWLFLLILLPPLFFYILPFVKTKASPWGDFQAVEPQTRLWLLYAYCALIFLASALSHLAGSSR